MLGDAQLGLIIKIVVSSFFVYLLDIGTTNTNLIYLVKKISLKKKRINERERERENVVYLYSFSLLTVSVLCNLKLNKIIAGDLFKKINTDIFKSLSGLFEQGILLYQKSFGILP